MHSLGGSCSCSNANPQRVLFLRRQIPQMLDVHAMLFYCSLSGIKVSIPCT